MDRLRSAHGLPGDRIGHRRVLQVLEPLPDSPTDREGLCHIGVDRRGKDVDEALVGIGRLVDDDLCSRRDSAGLFDIERGFESSRTRRWVRRVRHRH